MKALVPAPEATTALSAAGRRRMRAMRWEPLFLASWDRTLMLHYEIAPDVLQPFVPFELDVRGGNAYVSLVAFTMRGLRPRRDGWITRAMFAPIATHEFLNVRTYVKHGGESGIFFLAEWLPNALSVLLGRPLFGLPYRLGRMRYEHTHERGEITGQVVSSRGRGVLGYRAAVGDSFAPCEAGSLDEFLMERYTAFTEWFGLKRRFRVWHPPWPQCAVRADVIENSLLRLTGSWADQAKFIGANYSPGVADVWMSRPAFAINFKHQLLTPKSKSMITTATENNETTALKRLAKIKTAARLALGFVWVWEGLLPKMLWPSQLQCDMVLRSGWWVGSPEATVWWLGLAMVAAGLAIMSGLAERLAVGVATIAVLVLMVLVIGTYPAALCDPFGGLAKDACLFVCAGLVWFWPRNIQRVPVAS